MDLSLGIWRFVDMGADAARVKAVNIKISKVSELLRESACSFQLEYANYQFLASRFHRDYKNAFINNPDNSCEEHNDLTDFIEKGLKKLCGDQAESIDKYFKESRSSLINPRISIYAVNDVDEIIDIIQLNTSSNGVSKCLGEYSKFDDIEMTGTPYLNNNIPRSVIRKKSFKHKEIDIQKVKTSYKRRLKDKKLLSRWRSKLFKILEEDANWQDMKCKDVHNGIIYKSNLTVPITFRAHADKARLDESMINILDMQDDGRSILGFISIDHPETYYFDDSKPDTFDNIDINHMYYFADMISLIFVTAFMYTVGSSTYSQYIEFCEVEQ